MTEPNFRCPFELKGEREGKILHVHLNDSRDTRFQLMKAAFERFHADRSIFSIKFHLPASLLGVCNSLESLRMHIIPYQSEILGAELNYRLAPFFSYQLVNHTKEELERTVPRPWYKLSAARRLEEIAKAFKCPIKDVSNVADWIGMMFLDAVINGRPATSLGVHDDKGVTHLTIGEGSTLVHAEDYKEIVGEEGLYRNCFGIVTSPFYPKAFARYSEDVTFVMSRMRDFTDLDQEFRRKLRRASNTVYRDHGVEILDLDEDKQPEGLWIPKYVNGRLG